MIINSLKTQNDYLQDWLPKREEQLASLLAAAAPKTAELKCSLCDMQNSKWRCKGCFGQPLLCTRCCQSRHKLLPFHRIEKWNGKYFQAGALWQVGVKLQLGHDGFGCPGAANVEGESITTFWVCKSC